MPENQPHSFQTTRWSLVALVKGVNDEPMARAALGELCQQSWFPIYAYVRHHGMSPVDAEDVTQGFFEHLLTRSLITQARRDHGRFRSFLLGCLKNYLNNEGRKKCAQCRGGHLIAIHLDALEAEERYRMEAQALSSNDEDIFDRNWAQDIIDRTMILLRAEQRDDVRFDHLARALTGGEDRSAIMAATGMSESALKVAIHRLRKRYRELLRGAVRETVASESEVDEELHYLAACMRR